MFDYTIYLFILDLVVNTDARLRLICINSFYMVVNFPNQMNSGYVSWDFRSLKGSVLSCIEKSQNCYYFVFIAHGAGGEFKTPRIVREALLGPK